MREIWVSKPIGLACSWKETYHFQFVLLCIRGQISSTSPPGGGGGGGGLFWGGRFNEGFFALRFWGAYIWRGLKPLKKRPLKNISPGAYFRNELD